MTSENEIVLTREFDAPRDLLFKVWTEPEHIEQWWGPNGFSTEVKVMDLRPGGKWQYIMKDPDGAQYPVNGVFAEVDVPERIVTTDDFGEGDYESLNVELPQGIVVTALFEDLGKRSRLIIRIAHPTAEDRQKHIDMGVVAGWNSSLDCMSEYLVEIRTS